MYAYIQACILIGKRGEEEKNCLAHWGMYACNRPDIFLLRTKSRLAELTSSAILSSSLTMCVCRRSSTTSRMSSYPACQPTSLSHYLSLSFSLSFSFSPTQLYNCTTTIRTYILLFTSARHHCLKLIEKGKKGRRRKKNWPVFLSFPFSLSLSLSFIHAIWIKAILLKASRRAGQATQVVADATAKVFFITLVNRMKDFLLCEKCSVFFASSGFCTKKEYLPNI